jgi:predicted RNase H-like HicB family nuclease
MRYMVVVERAAKNFAAYVPDLPGCIATGRTLEQVQRRIAEAIRLHLKGMEDDGSPAPHPTAQAFKIGPRPPAVAAARAVGRRRRRLAS